MEDKILKNNCFPSQLELVAFVNDKKIKRSDILSITSTEDESTWHYIFYYGKELEED